MHGTPGTSEPNLEPDLETLHYTVINLIFALLLLFTKCLVKKPLVACSTWFYLLLLLSFLLNYLLVLFCYILYKTSTFYIPWGWKVQRVFLLFSRTIAFQSGSWFWHGRMKVFAYAPRFTLRKNAQEGCMQGKDLHYSILRGLYFFRISHCNSKSLI